METEATLTVSNDARRKLVDEMHRYTEVILGEPRGVEAKATHIGRCSYSSKGELIGFYLEPLNKLR